MKRNTPEEQSLTIEGRDLLVAWATAPVASDDQACRAVVDFVERVRRALSVPRVASVFSSAAFAAIMSLARQGRVTGSLRLLQQLDRAAVLSGNSVALSLVHNLRCDLATYLRGEVPSLEETDIAALASSVFSM